MLVGLDIGGTKIEGVGLIQLSDGRYESVVKVREPTRKQTYSEFLESVFKVIEDVAEYGVIESIGVGCCGSVGIDGLIQGANVTVMNGRDFVGDLKQRFDVSIAIANDADCFALSEFRDGAAEHAKNSCVAVILGTGCGSGIIVNQQLVTGLNRLGGEVGHNPLPNFNPDLDGTAVKCYCGSMNCTESFVSGTGIARTFSEKHFKADSKQIMQLVEQGDAAATQHFERYCDQLARFFAQIINFIDPEVIVLGGGMSNISAIYPIVNEKVSQYTFTKSVETLIVKNKHGDSSGVRGAAFLNL
ncbi:ROK family protein [Vibrio sp. WXL103]|uniref:ROK family protein n=1 Tax=Vibrio sp. WXL103 TaxID=3450710 RepID=UPI003EC62D10